MVERIFEVYLFLLQMVVLLPNVVYLVFVISYELFEMTHIISVNGTVVGIIRRGYRAETISRLPPVKVNCMGVLKICLSIGLISQQFAKVAREATNSLVLEIRFPA